MGDQWDWIESYCRVCNTPLGNTSGYCDKHTTHKQLKSDSNIKSLKWNFNRRKN